MRIKEYVILALFLLTCSVTAVHAQETARIFSGTVRDSDGKCLMGVVCRLQTPDDSLISYSLTNRNGEYKLPVNKDAGKIVFSFVGYETESRLLTANIYDYPVTLYQKSYNLKEVEISVTPINRHKDTLNYNVASFIQKEDVHIDDVLRRLPGIEVAQNGEITYQGKSINKLNIEGLDLMGDKYNQATRNMPASAVAQIQVMENNQPVRVLDGMVRNNHATLNIRLKKDYRLRPFGEIEGGMGKGENAIWANSATAIKVSPENQWLITGTMDNRGISLASLAQDMANHDRMYTNEPLPAPIIENVASQPIPISPLYYLDNKSYFLGVNHLHAFTKYSTVRFNLLYNHESISRNDSLFCQYVANDTVAISQQACSTRHSDIAKAQVRYELNTSSWYLEDIVTGELSWRSNDDNIVENSDRVIQDTYSPYSNFQNILNGHFKTDGRIFTFSSIIRNYSGKERLALLYTDEEGCIQKVRQSSLFMRHRIMSTFHLWKNTLNLAYILEGKSNNIRNIETNTDNWNRYWLHTFEPSYMILITKGELNINLPFEYISHTVCHKVYHKWMFSPSVDLDVKLSSSLSGDISVGYNQNTGTTEALYHGVLYNNYRTFTAGIDSLAEYNTATANIRLSYLNTSSLLSMNLFLGWFKQNKNYLQDIVYFDAFTLIEPQWIHNDHTTYSAAYNVKKIYRAAGLDINYSLKYAYNSRMVSQNKICDMIRYHALSSILKMQCNRLTWMHVMTTGGYNLHWKERDDFSVSHNVLKDFEYMVKLDVFPCAKLHCYVDYSCIWHEISNGSYSVAKFLNSGVQWNISKSIKIKGNIVNLLNTKSYRESVYDGSNYMFYNVPLRGREFMMSVNFCF